ncbi:MAG: hypothetical protein K0R08_1011 [Solimicrobium sp.]|nr:hypothetical protein [Solimicrobium sp.]
MDQKNYIKKLRDMCQLDIDAVNAYETALKKIDDKEIHNAVEQFRQDHLRHVEELNNLIRKLGGTPTEFTKDLKGYLIEGMTALRSVTGTKGALKAMETNEFITNKNYAEAVRENTDFPEEGRALLQKNYADEKRHLAYIQATLKNLTAPKP